MHGRIEKLGDRLARTFNALIRAVCVVVHKRDLLPWLIRNVKITLKIRSKMLHCIRGCEFRTLSMMKSSLSMKFCGPP
jgi:hypothetical protein